MSPDAGPDLAAVLGEDHHVHTSYSDDAVSSVRDNVSAAARQGLGTLGLTDHVRVDTTWVDEYVAAVRAAADGAGLRVLCGVEVKILDAQGRLDLPAGLPELDRVLLADHQYPGPDGPETPMRVREWLDRNEITAEQVVDTIVTATARAMHHTARPQLAHLFSILPKVGLDERVVGPDQVRFLADAARSAGAVIEANEKWGCPGPAVLAGFVAAGVPVVAGSDSHRAADVGQYRRVTDLLAGVGRR